MSKARQTRKSKKITAARTCAFSLFLMTPACGGHESAKDPSSAKSSDRALPNAAGDVSGNGIREGDKAPTFSIDSVNDRGKVAVTPGKVTLVDFWATWCPPCKKNFPKYQRLYTKYKGLEVAAVSVDDDKNGIAEFAASYGVTFPVGWDEDHKITDLYQPSGVPSLYILGKDGTVKYLHRGESAGDEIQIEKEIKSLLGQAQGPAPTTDKTHS